MLTNFNKSTDLKQFIYIAKFLNALNPRAIWVLNNNTYMVHLIKTKSKLNIYLLINNLRNLAINILNYDFKLIRIALIIKGHRQTKKRNQWNDVPQEPGSIRAKIWQRVVRKVQKN